MRGSIVAVILAMALGSPVWAEQGQGRFSVAVTVPARVTLEVIEQPAELSLTAQDVARGYKDVSARYLVRHNDRHGYLLQIAPRVGVTNHVEIRGLGAALVLRRDVIEIHQPGKEFLQEFELEFRFMLDGVIAPGIIELPLHVAAVPL